MRQFAVFAAQFAVFVVTLHQRTGYRVKRFTQISADSIRAAEVRSAEATELPVGKRPVVSVANGLCHPLGTGSRLKPPHRIVTDPARTPTARDDAVLIAWGLIASG
jgi:hypothetical protein